GRRIELTSREFSLLEFLLRHKDRVLSRALIAQRVWGLDFDTFTNVIDVYVNYLRRKVDADAEPKLIHTVRGVGYVLREPTGSYMLIGPSDVRSRLTLWYTSVLAALLVLLGVTAVVFLDRSLRQNVDASLRSVADAIAESSRDTARAGPSLEDLLDGLFTPGAGGLFALLDPRGVPDPRLAPRTRERLPLSATALRNADQGTETFETIPLPGVAAPIRLLTLPVTNGGRVERLVQVAASLDTVEAARHRFVLILMALAPLALLGAAAGGWWVAGRALAPVDRITETARRITAEDLARRIDAPASQDEIGRLVGVRTAMLPRLERAFVTARQFSADAAHELRTPLTILKGEIEVGLRTPASDPETHRLLASCLEEVDRLIAMVEDLLFLARTDAGMADPPREPVDLADVLEDAAPAI